jgi:hypothetical protein
MRPLTFAVGAVLLVALWSSLQAQKSFREYEGWEYYGFPLPPDYREPGEWVFARLAFPSIYGGWGRRGGGVDTRWTTDYPRCDRHIAMGLRRLTRVNARSVEQVVSLSDDDIFNWPFLYGVSVGFWNLNDKEIDRFREYINRGGFFMCDDFHGEAEWENFMGAIRRMFPNRTIVDLDDSEAIFHVLYDLENRGPIPGAQYLRGQMWERGGVGEHWRGMYDEKGRLVMAICFNMDIGDALEHSDSPAYPEKFSSLAYRVISNYTVYAMTH